MSYGSAPILSFRTLVGAACILLLICAMWASAQQGLSSLYAAYASATNEEATARTAIAWNDSNPEPHYTLGAVLANHDQPSAAIAEFQRAIKLKPRDYYLWLKLGRAQDLAGNQSAALGAFDVAVKLAPYYAQPHWELGNLLLRGGERERAFLELRRAAESNIAFLPAVIDLAGAVYTGETRMIRQAVNPQTAGSRLALARYFAIHGELKESLDLLQEAGNEAAETQRHELLSRLLEQQRFGEAYQVWLSGRETDSPDVQKEANALMSDGGFERQPAPATEAGFDWRIGDEAETSVKVSLDPNGARAGEHSLRLDWGGDSHPALSIVSQLVIVNPGRRYRLAFAARTEDLVSGGLPFVAVADAGAGDAPLLGESASLPRETGGWRNYMVEFSTGEKTSAVRIFLRRQCATTPCPIYGRVWLDDFSLSRL